MLSAGMHFRMCKLVDLSMGGAFLDIGWGALTRDQPVELSLTIHFAGNKQVYRLPAKVSRITASGTAVRFGSLDVPTHRALSTYIVTLAQQHNNPDTQSTGI